MEAGRNFVYGTSPRKLENPTYVEKKIEKQRVHTINYAKEKAIGVVLIFIIFAFLFWLIFRYAMITEMEYKRVQLNKEYSRLKDETAKLKIAIESNTDPNKIKKMAEEMGLQQPEKMQKVYIMVPKSDFTTVAQQYKKDTNATNPIVASVFRLFN